MRSEGCEELLVHFGELEAFPEVSNRYLLVSHVGYSDQRVVSLAVDADLGLLDSA